MEDQPSTAALSPEIVVSTPIHDLIATQLGVQHRLPSLPEPRSDDEW